MSSVWVVCYSKVMQCNVMQSHAMSCKVCKVSRDVESHTCSVNFTLLSRCFACIQAFQAVGEKWLSITGGLRNSNWSVYLFMLFLPEAIFICRTLQKSNFLQNWFCSFDKHEGVWSNDSDWHILVLTIESSQSSGSPFVSDNLYPLCRSSLLQLLINLPWNDMAGRNAWPMV